MIVKMNIARKEIIKNRNFCSDRHIIYIMSTKYGEYVVDTALTGLKITRVGLSNR